MEHSDNTAEVFAARASAALSAGNYLLCYDLVDQARQLGVQTRRLQYLSLLALANAGSTDFAWRRYRELGLGEDELDEDWLALQGRLLKDLALGGGSRDDFRASALAYLGAFRQTGGYFTAVNAATMFLLAGDAAASHQLAREVLTLAGGLAPADEMDHYYLRASEAEAALLLGDAARCRASLQAADRLARGNVNARSRTCQQLRLICRQLDLADEFSALLTVPALFYLERSAAEVDVAFGAARAAPAVGGGLEAAQCEGARVYAALVQPADLCAAEYFQSRGARLALVLPAARRPLIEHWQRSFGAGWAMRLARCLDQVGELTVTQGFLEEERDWAGGYVAAMAQGLARLNARRLGGQCRRVELAPSATPPGYWLHLDEGCGAVTLPAAQPPVRHPDAQRRFVGLIFADIAGFRRLQDAEMPRFWSQVMGGVAQILDRSGAKVLFRHTWGDAINVVTEDAASAAAIAVAIQACIDEVRRRESGALGGIELRLAAHFAPAFAGFDPVEKVGNYYGSQLSFTARIEPVTPPGMIFVTEAFAARLALETPEQQFFAEYAGEVELAKRFGKYRLFSLQSAERRRNARLQLAGGTEAGMPAARTR
jgi:hypothetical protein